MQTRWFERAMKSVTSLVGALLLMFGVSAPGYASASLERIDVAQIRQARAILRDESAALAEQRNAVQLLKAAAQTKDHWRLIVHLEMLRTAGHPAAPSLSDMIAIERALASAGVPQMAWRLVRRYEAGELPAPHEQDYLAWLNVSASEGGNILTIQNDARFRLCGFYLGQSAPQLGRAHNWCAAAADAGHLGAQIMLRFTQATNGQPPLRRALDADHFAGNKNN